MKTHRLPRDQEPAIYVVRDGRSAISSFLAYELVFSAGARAPSMLDLVLGEHYYGGWTDHYRAWHSRGDARTLTVEYSDLFHADTDTLARLAAFIEHADIPTPWNNPIETARAEFPDVVGDAHTRWSPSKDWTPLCDLAFWTLHGDLMRELRLGCAETDRIPLDTDETIELIRTLKRAVDEKRDLIESGRRKEQVIAELASELAIQRAAASERLALIETMRVQQE